MFFLDAGTTYSKIISTEKIFESKYLINKVFNEYYYIIPSSVIKTMNFKPSLSCGHMINATENEIIALAEGAMQLRQIQEDKEAVILDLGSRDAKWIKLRNGKFYDMDWNTSCASSTGATVEMLLKFYNISVDDLLYQKEKFTVTCGIFGMEKIMDSISNGERASAAISKFLHGIAYNDWKFCKEPDKIYLSGGFCSNRCLIDSLKQYCDVEIIGRFVLCEGLKKIYNK